MRKANFLGHEITRLIVGDNPFGGHSYIDPIITGKEMKEFHYDTKKLYNTYFELEEAGYDCIFPLADPVFVQVLKEYKRDGGKMKFIFQSYGPLLDLPMVSNIASLDPIGIYVTGSRVDYCYETSGNMDEIKNTVKYFKELLEGKCNAKVGIGSHYPEIIEKAEAEDWGADFYATCLYNLRRERKGEQSGFITGRSKEGLTFYHDDRSVMLDVIAKVSKPCIAYKIFAGGHILLSEDENEVRRQIKASYREVFTRIKPNDIAAIGVFTKYKDQIKEDIELYHEVMDELENNK